MSKTDSKGYHVFACILFLSPSDTLYIESSYYEMVFHDILMMDLINYILILLVIDMIYIEFRCLSTQGRTFHIGNIFPQMLSECNLYGMSVCYGPYIHF